MEQSCLTAALRYARRGWRVFPLNGKKPYFSSWPEEATTDPRRIKRWWRRWPNANVAILCDSRHGPIVLDIDDPGKNNRGADLVDYLDLPPTREARSSLKTKRHLYFDPMTSGVKIPRLIKVRLDGKKYDLDILGDGGYVVAPPSVHTETGRLYKWISKIRPVPLPESVLQLVPAFTEETSKGPAAPLPTIIHEGERDTLLTSLAGSMRRRGASMDAILAALREENITRVVPPLRDKELRKIARSIAKKAPAGRGENLTDMGNARRFVAQHREYTRSLPNARHPWFNWEGTRWTPDDTGEVVRMAKSTIRSLYVEAEHCGDADAREQILKHAARSEQASRVRALLELAATEPEIALTPDSLDADPWLLNVENGTVDLRTGELRAHSRDDLITKMAPVEFNEKAKAPTWHAHLDRVFDGDSELVEFAQRAVGYALTGDTREECFFFCYGQGANGKTTFFETIRALLGDYTQQAEFSTFLARRGEGPRNDIARMRGARLVTAVEAQTDREFDLAVLKQLTGGDTVTARRLYEEAMEFKPQHKIFLAANHKPIIREQTEATWRRIRLIPFTVTIPLKDRIQKLSDKIVADELPGVLNWALEGCRLWQVDGLPQPKAITRATKAYREENNIIGEFLVRRCEFEPEGWSSASELYRTFADWWVDVHGPRSSPVSMGQFSRLLSETKNVHTLKRGGVRGWQGISLLLETNE